MMVDAISFNLGNSPSMTVRLASSEGLSPLPLPDAILRFQSAMQNDEAACMDTDTQRDASAEWPVAAVKALPRGLFGLAGLNETRREIVIVPAPVNEKTVEEEKVVVVEGAVVAEKTIVVDGPATVARPVVTEKTVVVERPVVADGLAAAAKPVVAEKTVVVERPVVADGLAAAVKPVVAERTVVVERPAVADGLAAAAKPVVAEKTVVVERPAAADGLAAAAKPVVAEDPVVVNRPMTSSPTTAAMESRAAVAEEVPTVLTRLEKTDSHVAQVTVPEVAVAKSSGGMANGSDFDLRPSQSIEHGGDRGVTVLPTLVSASNVDSVQEAVPLQEGSSVTAVSVPVVEKPVVAERTVVGEKPVETARPLAATSESSTVAMTEQPVVKDVEVKTGSVASPEAAGTEVERVVASEKGRIDERSVDGSLGKTANPAKGTAEPKEVSRTFARRETHDEPEVATALPAAPMPQALASAETVPAPQVAAVQAARTEAIVENVGKTVEIVNQVVDAVVAQITVSPTLAQGDGEIRITLKPTVLDGSEIRLTTKAGELMVSITPATGEAAQISQQNLQRLESTLAAHAPSFHHVAVVIASAKKGKMDETA